MSTFLSSFSIQPGRNYEYDRKFETLYYKKLRETSRTITVSIRPTVDRVSPPSPPNF